MVLLTQRQHVQREQIGLCLRKAEVRHLALRDHPGRVRGSAARASCRASAAPARGRRGDRRSTCAPRRTDPGRRRRRRHRCDGSRDSRAGRRGSCRPSAAARRPGCAGTRPTAATSSSASGAKLVVQGPLFAVALRSMCLACQSGRKPRSPMVERSGAFSKPSAVTVAALAARRRPAARLDELGRPDLEAGVAGSAARLERSPRKHRIAPELSRRRAPPAAVVARPWPPWQTVQPISRGSWGMGGCAANSLFAGERARRRRWRGGRRRSDRRPPSSGFQICLIETGTARRPLAARGGCSVVWAARHSREVGARRRDREGDEHEHGEDGEQPQQPADAEVRRVVRRRGGSSVVDPVSPGQRERPARAAEEDADDGQHRWRSAGTR